MTSLFNEIALLEVAAEHPATMMISTFYLLWLRRAAESWMSRLMRTIASLEIIY
jgi:hypothetical protein